MLKLLTHPGEGEDGLGSLTGALGRKQAMGLPSPLPGRGAAGTQKLIPVLSVQ